MVDSKLDASVQNPIQWNPVLSRLLSETGHWDEWMKEWMDGYWKQYLNSSTEGLGKVFPWHLINMWNQRAEEGGQFWALDVKIGLPCERR